MHPDQGCYEERYRLARGTMLALAGGLLALAIGFLLAGPLAVGLTFLGIAAITALPAVIGPATRRIAFRADQAGITLGADLRDSWPFRRDRAVFVPWADVEQVIIYPRPGYPAGSPARCIGIQRRPDTPDLAKYDEPAPGCPLPRVTAAATQPVSGWRLDRDRLAAVTAAVAPGIPVIDASTGPIPRLGGPASG
jgi:hypothetical protein